MEYEMEWWGFSKQHGWVVLDRSISSNGPGFREDLLFFRCRDSMTFTEKREKWNPPQYRFAPNHLRELAAAERVEATAELDALKSLWPEQQREMQLELRESAKRAEVARIEEEKKQKEAAREEKRQGAAARQ
jgi:hypothetical protein